MKLEFCKNGCECDLIESGLDGQMQEYAGLGAIPHCFFPELCEKHLVAADIDDFNSGSLTFYTSPAAFYQEHESGCRHVHISLAQVHAAFSPNSASISFVLDQGNRIELAAEESGKLLQQAEFACKRLFPAEENIEIAAGEQLIFSTPDPEVPQGFLQFLAENFRSQVEAVYVFETTVPGQPGNLVIAVVPVDSGADASVFSLQLAQGADMFLEDRSQIDFMLLDPKEKELIEVIASVSPEIELGMGQ